MKIVLVVRPLQKQLFYVCLTLGSTSKILLLLSDIYVLCLIRLVGYEGSLKVNISLEFRNFIFYHIDILINRYFLFVMFFKDYISVCQRLKIFFVLLTNAKFTFLHRYIISFCGFRGKPLK